MALTNKFNEGCVDFADTLFGVGSATSAGPTLPAGSIHPSPITLKNDCGGYLREQPIIGFGQAFVSGAGGTKCYGNFLLSPTVDKIELEHSKRASFAKKEEGHCYEYKVTLENDISVNVTPSQNSAIYSIEYPKEKQPYLMIDVAHKLDIDASLKKGGFTIDPEKKSIYGGGTYFGNWNNLPWDMFFALEFDGEFEEVGCFKGTDIYSVSYNTPTTVSIDEETRLGAYIKFASNKNKKVSVKIAISFVSCDLAKKFLIEQIPEFNYEVVKQEAKTKWKEIFNAINIRTDDSSLLRRFYTAMYHMNVQPRNRTNDHGKWDDFHTVWDTWKTVFPMYSLLYPKKVGAIIDSMIDRAKENERLGNGVVVADEYMSAKEGLAGQGGNDVDNVIVDAYLKGVQLSKYTWEEAFSVLLRSAELMRTPEYITKGFSTQNRETVTGVPYTARLRPASATMGFAFNDKAISTMAHKMGKIEEYEKYEKRSANWLNVWNFNNQSEGFTGFPQNCNEDGSFDQGFDAHRGYNEHFYEATGWDASYINYNDVDRMVETMGGAETFTKRLVWACENSVNYYNDDYGREGYLNFTNEPSFHIPWLFCTEKIRRPDLASKVIDGIIKRFSQKNDYPGDEDNGGMSSYYIFLMCGFFPFATTDKYYLHGTRVEEIVFNLGNGKKFLVSGENVGDKNIYVQSATWQGKPHNDCFLTHKQLLEGGELHFVMGDKPSDWARR